MLGGLVVGLVYGLVFGLNRIRALEAVKARQDPNQGTRRSISAALVAGLIYGLSFGFALGLFGGLNFGFALGLIGGLLAALVWGGVFAARHFSVRLLLWTTRVAPLNYVRFLDHAADRLFLRKVGGGYIFIHRTVMEYFVSLADKSDFPRSAPVSGK